MKFILVLKVFAQVLLALLSKTYIILWKVFIIKTIIALLEKFGNI